MFLQALDLSTALRPELYAEETLLFVQDDVGLYEGKFKIPEFQHGHVYLTSHRICYVDNAEPRKNSTSVDLKEVDKYEFYAGFLKSSPKITLYPKPPKRSSIQARTPSLYTQQASSIVPSRSATASPLARGGSPRPGLGPATRSPITWVCPICSYSNSLPGNFDPTTVNANTPLPPCKACGIKPPLAVILKAAISNASVRQSVSSVQSQQQSLPDSRELYSGNALERYDIDTPIAKQPSFKCPRCTFENHPQLLSCEMCGASLVSAENLAIAPQNASLRRSDSPGPLLGKEQALLDNVESIKLSFRSGGEKIFHERLKGAMIQRKWVLQNAPPIPGPWQSSNIMPTYSGASTPDRVKAVGIAGLERLEQDQRKTNESIISGAFDDFESLMTSAKEIIAMAESLAKQTSKRDMDSMDEDSTVALNMATTKEMLGSASGSENLYLSELSRNLAEYLTDDRRGVLRKEGGIMPLVDLWATFNRARNGVELVSPSDFLKAARMWEKLILPVRLREFRNGLLVVQRSDWTDDKTIAQLLAWLQELHVSPPADQVPWDWSTFGDGVTAHAAATRFGWSLGVATEELEMAEEKGVLCREDGVQGPRFWENRIVNGLAEEPALAQRLNDLHIHDTT